MQKKVDTDKFEKKEDKRKSPAVKPKNFDGSTPAEAFFSNSECAHIITNEQKRKQCTDEMCIE